MLPAGVSVCSIFESTCLTLLLKPGMFYCKVLCSNKYTPHLRVKMLRNVFHPKPARITSLGSGVWAAAAPQDVPGQVPSKDENFSHGFRVHSRGSEEDGGRSPFSIEAYG